MDKLSEHSKILLLGAASLILGVVFVFLFYKQGIGLNYALFMMLVVGFGLLMARVFSRHLPYEHYAVIASGIFFSSMVFVRSGELLTFYNILGSVLLLLISVSMFAGEYIRTFVPSDYAKVFFLPFRFIGPFFETFLVIVSLNKVPGGNTRTKEIIRGSIMAIIALLVFACLFASADAGFEKLLSRMFTLRFDQDMVKQIFLGAFVAAFFVGGFGFMFKKLYTSRASSSLGVVRNLGAIETMILLGSINVLFLVFIILQVSYLFGGAGHLLSEGLTYAEYAREGFFQLVVVAILSFLIISFSERQIIQNNGAHLRSFKVWSGVLVLQVIVILVSAFTRLSLYEHAYGFTDTRFYGHAFMIWLGVVLLLLSLHIRKSGKQEDFSFHTFCTVVILLFVLNVLNPDVFIAKKNLERYHTTGLLDAAYLASLSDDALPYTIQLLDDPNEEIRKSFTQRLSQKDAPCDIDGCEEVRPYSWKSSRWNRAKAQELLTSKRSIL